MMSVLKWIGWPRLVLSLCLLAFLIVSVLLIGRMSKDREVLARTDVLRRHLDEFDRGITDLEAFQRSASAVSPESQRWDAAMSRSRTALAGLRDEASHLPDVLAFVENAQAALDAEQLAAADAARLAIAASIEADRKASAAHLHSLWTVMSVLLLLAGIFIAAAILLSACVCSTTRRCAEAALRESEHRYRVFSELASDYLYQYRITEDGAFILEWASGSFQRVWNTSIEEFNKNGGWKAHVHPDDRATVDARCDRLLAGEPVSDACRVITHAGDERWIHSDTRPIRDETTGTIVGLIGATRDITEYKRAEAALRKSETRFRGMVQDQTDLICRFKPDGVLTFVNDAYCRYFDKSREKLIGTAFFPLLPKEDLELTSRHLERITPENPVASVEHRVYAPDGAMCWNEWTDRAILDEHGTIVEYQAVGRDITERKNAQFELRDAIDRQRLLLRELDHRVKNALSGLLTLIELCRERESTVDDFACAIARRVRTMLTVHELLGDARWDDIDLARLIRTIIPTDAPGQIEYGGETVRIPAQQATSLGMILQELTSNSLKHGALGCKAGSVRIRWDVTSEPADAQSPDASLQRLTMHWDEFGADHVEQNPTGGLGTSLIEGFLRHELRGSIQSHYKPDGVRLVMSAVLTRDRRDTMSHFDTRAHHRNGQPAIFDASRIEQAKMSVDAPTSSMPSKRRKANGCDAQ